MIQGVGVAYLVGRTLLNLNIKIVKILQATEFSVIRGQAEVTPFFHELVIYTGIIVAKPSEIQ
jgi:hypothetical protein